MHGLLRSALSLLALNPSQLPLDSNANGVQLQTPPAPAAFSKRIAIVGGGMSGIYTLKTLLADLPQEVTKSWEIVLFEERGGVGGVWLPDGTEPHPPNVPKTPLYPRLRTNTPHPIVMLPHFPFPPLTPLYPNHTFVLHYLESIVSHWNLSSHVRLRHEVLETRWAGTNASGHWALTARGAEGDLVHAKFDHLIVANGHNRYPAEPYIEGRTEWETSVPGRLVLHSVYYRDPEAYRGRNVIVVGGGPSGRDLALQIVGSANSTYASVRTNPAYPDDFPDIPGVTRVPEIARFTRDTIVLKDNTTLTHIDTVLLATGYDRRVDFLEAGGGLTRIPRGARVHDPADAPELTNSGRYMRPLFRHVLSLAPTYPLGALYFVGVPIIVSNAMSDSAQALFVAHTLANPALLAQRSTFLADLRAQEALAVARAGHVDTPGHRIVGPGGGADYQDGLVGFLQQHGLGGRGGVPPTGTPFTEGWRRLCAEHTAGMLRRAWARVEGGGYKAIRHWLRGVHTEAQWANLTARLLEWERQKEDTEGSYTPSPMFIPDW
ncbi:hypothetical protein BC834DRAFT_274353 [Gloeopeniophorella convolvens]|nr:hypothetical protein BC834DRAFT_274353 [Gloeopeniophorella convolvens]